MIHDWPREDEKYYFSGSDGLLPNLEVSSIGAGANGSVIAIESIAEGRIVVKSPVTDDGKIDLDALGQLIRENRFLEVLTNPRGDDNDHYLGGVVQRLAFTGPSSVEGLEAYGDSRIGLFMPRLSPIDTAHLDNQRIVDISMDLSYPLARLHRWGIIHQDVKPSNVGHDGHIAKLLDFGLAGVYDSKKLPEHARQLADLGVTGGGTIIYQAPELIASGYSGSASSDGLLIKFD